MDDPAETTSVPMYARCREPSCMRLSHSLTLRVPVCAGAEVWACAGTVRLEVSASKATAPQRRIPGHAGSRDRRCREDTDEGMDKGATNVMAGQRSDAS